MSDRNDVVIEAWNTVLFDKFVRFKHLLVDGSRGPQRRGAGAARASARRARARHRLRLRRQHACGSPPSWAPPATAVGVDCAANFIQAAKEDAARAGAANASFFVADVQADDLRGPYDHAFARFGTMFFMIARRGAAQHPQGAEARRRRSR